MAHNNQCCWGMATVGAFREACWAAIEGRDGSRRSATRALMSMSCDEWGGWRAETRNQINKTVTGGDVTGRDVLRQRAATQWRDNKTTRQCVVTTRHDDATQCNVMWRHDGTTQRDNTNDKTQHENTTTNQTSRHSKRQRHDNKRRRRYYERGAGGGDGFTSFCVLRLCRITFNIGIDSACTYLSTLRYHVPRHKKVHT